jgi:hypothetical protein
MKSARSVPPYSLREIFRVPLWIALFSIVGLVCALIGDDWLDVLSWIALTIPLFIIGQKLYASKVRNESSN